MDQENKITNKTKLVPYSFRTLIRVQESKNHSTKTGRINPKKSKRKERTSPKYVNVLTSSMLLTK